MPVTNYYSLDGEIIGEKTTGSPRVDYLTDALGSVTATVNQNAQVVNTYRYKPYGALLAKTGTGTDPAFHWVGTQGYRQTGRLYSDVYIRARHYDSASGRWTSRDPVMISRRRGSFSYGESSPAYFTDSSGLTCQPPKDCCPQAIEQAKKQFKSNCTGGNWEACSDDDDSKLQTACNNSGNCNAIYSALRDTINMCVGMCGKARIRPKPGTSPNPYPPGTQLDMMDVCCDKKDCGIFCCNRGASNPPRSYDPCVLYCLYQHEKRHGAQCTGKVSPPKNIPNPGAWAECDAYYQQVQRLITAATSRGCDISSLSNLYDACVYRHNQASQ